MSAPIASFVISSKSPRKLAEFYSSLIQGDLKIGNNNNHFYIDLSNGLKIHFYKASKDRHFPFKGSFSSICFQKETSNDTSETLSKWIASLIPVGAIVVEDIRNESFGSEAWLSDPEGNYFLLLVSNDM